MDSHAILREQALLRIEQGKLPSQPPSRVWGGAGVYAACAVCDQLISPAELEFETELATGPPSDARVIVFHVHTTCYAMWALVGDSRAKSRGATPDGPATSSG